MFCLFEYFLIFIETYPKKKSQTILFCISESHQALINLIKETNWSLNNLKNNRLTKAKNTTI